MRLCLAIAFALVVACVLPACTCSSSSETVAAIDEPEAQIVYWEKHQLKEVARDVGVHESSGYVLQVEGYPPRRIPGHWPKEAEAELVADSEGARLAFRRAAEPWSVVYLQGEGRSFLSLESQPELDWKSVPAFEVAAPALWGVWNDATELIVAVRDNGGDDAVAALLLTSMSDGHGVERGKDPWLDAALALPSKSQATVRDAVREHLLEHDTYSTHFQRRAPFLVGNDAGVPERLRAIASGKAMPKTPKAAGGEPVRMYGDVYVVALIRAAALDLDGTAELACTLVDGAVTSNLKRAAILVLAAARRDCAAMRAHAELICSVRAGPNVTVGKVAGKTPAEHLAEELVPHRLPPLGFLGEVAVAWHEAVAPKDMACPQSAPK